MKNYFGRTIQFVILAGLVALVNCGKDDPAPIKEAELTSGSGKWKLTALTVKAAGQSADAYADLDECDKDDILYFKDDGTCQLEAGATKCDVSEPTILDEGTWEISDKNLSMDLGDAPGSGKINLLNSTTLKTTETIDFLGVSATIISTFTKQP